MPDALPPPPDDPARPPPTRLEGEEPVRFSATVGGPSLAGMLRVQPGPRALLVLHPHSLYGGTMDNAVVVAITRLAARRGYSTLRFNFRGALPSDGVFDHGRGETDDALAALDLLRARAPHAALDAVGYSFGSYVLHALAARAPGTIARLALLAPAPGVFEYPAAPLGPTAAVLIGTRDDLTPEGDARSLAVRAGAHFVALPGADHYFTRGRADLAARVLDTLEASP